jgi:hypothetical protein
VERLLKCQKNTIVLDRGDKVKGNLNEFSDYMTPQYLVFFLKKNPLPEQHHFMTKYVT